MQNVLIDNNQPCFVYTKMLINAHITKIIYRKEYPDDLAIKMLKEAGIPFVKV